MSKKSKCDGCYAYEVEDEDLIKCPVRLSKYRKDCPCIICLFKVTCRNYDHTCPEYQQLLKLVSPKQRISEAEYEYEIAKSEIENTMGVVSVLEEK